MANKIEETKHISMEERPKLIKIKECKKFKQMLEKVNAGLKNMVPEEISLTELNHVNYGAAWYI